MDIQELVTDVASSGAIQSAVARVGVDPAEAQSVLQGVLEHVDAGGGIESLVENVAAKTGVDPATVQAVLPHIMPLLQSHGAGAPGGASAGLGGLLGSLGSVLGASDTNQAVGALEGLAGSFFGRKS